MSRKTRNRPLCGVALHEVWRRMQIVGNIPKNQGQALFTTIEEQAERIRELEEADTAVFDIMQQIRDEGVTAERLTALNEAIGHRLDVRVQK